MPELRSVSIAAPAYNEGAIIEGIVETWVTHLKSLAWVERFEIAICNDGSGDDTGDRLDRLATIYPEVRPVHFPINQGAAAALARAIEATSFDWVFLIDSDGQFPIENLTPMMEAIERSGAKAAIGVRHSKQNSLFAQLGSRASAVFCNFFHGTKYRDFNCALKLVDGALLRSIPLEAKGLNYSTEISSKLIERDAAPIEVDIEHRPRVGGKSSLKLLKGARDRFLFVMYLGFRQLLIHWNVLRRPHV
ncbi:glycosyltransferase family 2 protein [uncultured Paludibaculum sp.]|uniref:glycosyltransferase family 2 protein n=1 Tax=uncultured Paludibaculum sp. TaxID=1765020 RepID=UPI002AAACD99|nr:glycosyltransferase family 2 protein [uncultured Paludibaculum sp.]